VQSFILTAETLGGFIEIYKAADKYQFTHVQRLLKTMLEHPAVLDIYPHRAFAIARRCGIEPIARRAAFSLVAIPSIPTNWPEMAWDEGQKLLKFSTLCRDTARTILEGQKHSHRYYIENEEDPRQPLMRRPNERNGVFVWWDTGAPSHNEACAPGCTGKNLKFDTEGFGTFWRLETPTTWFRNHIEHLTSQMPGINLRQRLNYTVLRECDRKILDSCQRCSQWAKKDLSDFALRLDNVMTDEKDRICALPFLQLISTLSLFRR
jgi:hypothetical protein